jgi:predicted Zn-dependent protease
MGIFSPTNKEGTMTSISRIQFAKWAPLMAGILACAMLSPVARGQFGGFAKKAMEKAKKAQEASKPISVDEEKDIGREVSAKMIAAFHVYANDALTRYVNEVGDTVAAQSGRNDIQYHFAVLDSDDINAYSAPGGYVFITKGALALCQDESELAGVLAHEVGHIAAKHVIHEIESANRKSALASEVGDDVGNLTQNAPGSSLYKNAIQNIAKGIIATIFDRGLPAKDEYEADSLGARYAHDAGYPSNGLERFLTAFETATTQDGKQSYMTHTHPPVRDRNERITQLIAQQNWQDADRPQLADRYSTMTAELKPKAGS